MQGTKSMSATDPNASSFSEQLEQRLQFLLDTLGPDEMRSFLEQADADLADEASTNGEALSQLEKFEGTLALYLIRATKKAVMDVRRVLNTGPLAD
jgi:hypothetical protein